MFYDQVKKKHYYCTITFTSCIIVFFLDIFTMYASFFVNIYLFWEASCYHWIYFSIAWCLLRFILLYNVIIFVWTFSKSWKPFIFRFSFTDVKLFHVPCTYFWIDRLKNLILLRLFVCKTLHIISINCIKYNNQICWTESCGKEIEKDIHINKT